MTAPVICGKCLRMNANHYKSIGKMIKERVEASYGKQWKKCIGEDVAKALVAREAFFIMMGNHGDGAAADLVAHGRAAYEAGLAACGLTEEEV